MWKAIRYRRVQAIVFAALAALITACAAFAPLYDRALQQALVGIRLNQQPVEITGLSLFSAGDARRGPSMSADSMGELVPAQIRRYLRPPVASTSIKVTLVPNRPQSPTGTALWRAGMCEHVTFVSGRCPMSADEIAVSTADVKTYGWHEGSHLPVVERLQTTNVSNPNKARMTVVGTYRVRQGDYWYGSILTGRSGVPDPDGQQPQFDVWLTAQGTMAERWVGAANEIDLPLAKDAVGVDQLLQLGPQVAQFTQAPMTQALRIDPNLVATARAYSGLPDIATEVAHGRDQARIIVPLLMVQLGLLAVVVLWLVLSAAVEQRRPEVALARLRGFGIGGARALLLREIGPVVLAGVPVGALAALGLSYLARHLWLPGHAPLEFGAGLLIALLVAVALLVVVMVLAVQGVARQQVSALLRRVPSRRAGWALGVTDAVVIAGSVVAIAAFATGGLSGPLALAAPSLLALAIGLVLAHVLVPVAAGGGRRLLAHGHVNAGVSALQMARRPATRRVVAIITVATALLVFSADALVVGARNRGFRADREVGAPMVATVAGSDVAGVRDVLRLVDPHGQDLTPVVLETPPGASGTTTQAVVPAQFRRIALFPGQRPGAIAWERLAAPGVPPLRLQGTWLTLRLSSGKLAATDTPPGGAPVPLTPVELRLRLVDSGNQLAIAVVGELPVRATAARTVRVLIPCAQGCSLTGLALATEGGQPPVQGSFTISDLATSTGQVARTGSVTQWPPVDDPESGSMTASSPGPVSGLAVKFLVRGPAGIVLRHGSVPQRLPALIAGALPSDAHGAQFAGVGLDGVERAMVAVGTLPFAPGGPADTSIVNLDILQRDGATPQFLTTLQVWFAHDDPALLTSLTRALNAHGIELASATTAADTLRTYDESAAAWGLQLGVVVSAAALLIAALVLVVVAATTWRLRARDFAALRMAGVSRARIGAMAAAEQLPAIVLAALVGAGCGVLGAHFALPMVPLFSTPPAVSTLDLSTAWAAVLAAALAALAVLTVIGWLCARWVAGRARLARVRESL